MFGQSLSLSRPGCVSTAPGRNFSVGALAGAGRGRGRGRGPSATEQPGEDKAAEGKAPPSPPKRLSKLFEKYQNDDLEAQQEEALRYAAERAEAALEAPKARDGRPALRASKAQNYVKGTLEIEKKRAKMFIFNHERNEDEANIGVYGKGKPCWWALRVNPGREKQVADGIDRLLKYLPPLRINCEDFPDLERQAECWVPAKKVRAWSPKTGKMGNKALKYDDGGFLLVKTIMDKAFVTMLNGNINVLGFQDREVFEGVEFPRPASAELLETVKKWEADLSDITEEQVKAQLGLDTVQLPATSEPSLEEFFYDEDVEASLAAQEEREARRAERGGGRFGTARGSRGRGGRGEGRGRGRFDSFSTRGGRTGGRSGFFPASDTGSNDRYNNRRTDDADGGWDRPPRRQQQQQYNQDQSSAGGDWYEGGKSSGTGSFDDDSSGWFTGTGIGGVTNEISTTGKNSTNRSGVNDSFDDDIGWFGADQMSANTTVPSPDTLNTGSRGGGGDGGLLSDDDDEFWTPLKDETPSTNKSSGVFAKTNVENTIRNDTPSAAAAAAASGGDDDLDAIWGAGMGGGESESIGGGWMSMDTPDTSSYDNNNARGDRGGGFNRDRDGGRGGERGGRGGDRFQRGERTSERSYDRGERSYERGSRDDRGGRGGRGGGSFDEGGRGGRDLEAGYSQSREGGRGGEFRESRRSSYRDTNEYSSSDSGDSRFSGGDDLSWWDAPTDKSANSGGGGAGSSAAAEKRTPPSSSFNKAPEKRSGNFNDGDDWFSDDAGYDSSRKSSGNQRDSWGSDEIGGSDGGGDANAPPLSAGTKVEVVSGRFQDFEGVIVESKGERVKAELDVFGTPTVVEISRGEVEPFES